MTFWQLIKAELQAIFTNKAVLSTVFGGVLLYSFLYPLPYSQQTPREQAIVVVNLDGSQLSRGLERMVDATPHVNIVRRAFSVHEATSLIVNGSVSGLLVIPENFYSDLRKGKRPTLSYAGDASYFLVFGTIVKGLAQAGGMLAAQARVAGLVQSGEPVELAVENITALQLDASPVFNATEGYINYVVPAIFVLVLHQTLLMGIALVGGTQREMSQQGGKGYWQDVSVVRLLLARILVFCFIYIPLCFYYFGFSFQHLGITRLAELSELCLFFAPFLIAAAALGAFLGSLMPRKELVILVVLASSFPIVFSAGFIWPLEALPSWINWLMQWIPATQAIRGFLGLNQMGASFAQMLGHWWALCGLGLLYFLAAWQVLAAKNKTFVV